jgi:hypothetical protein
MHRIRLGSSFILALLIAVAADRAVALPGQTVDEVAAWIQANPTLLPASGETLMVRKSDTPARRFSFEALLVSPGRAATGEGRGTVRTERIALFDMTNGVTPDRLATTLRNIYGDEIYQDFNQANLVYRYPTTDQQASAQNRDAPLLESLQGEIRQGSRFGYWIETVQTRDGQAYNGQINVFLLEDINKIEAELRDRG